MWSGNHVVHGSADSTLNRLQLETHANLAECWTGLVFNMKQQLWTLAFALALLRALLDFFHGEMDRNVALESQEGNPLNYISSINHTSLLHGSQEILFL